jgi:hypothetical protein
VTGAIWKAAENLDNQSALLDLKALELLCPLLTGQPEGVMVNVAGAICELATTAKARKVWTLEKKKKKKKEGEEEAVTLVALSHFVLRPLQVVRSAGGLEALVKHLSSTNDSLLVNVTRAVASACQDSDSMSLVEKGDGVRLLWSLLKSSNPAVVANSASALCPCLQ